MDCRIVKENLFAYKEGNLSGEQIRLFEEHLSGCVSCRALYAGFEGFEKAIEAQKKIQVDTFAKTRILQKLENRLYGSSYRKIAILRPLAIILVMLLAVAAGIFIGSSGVAPAATAASDQQQIETLRSDLFIAEFADEDILDLTNN
jgi:predicted anti-sigma-YlaC factor YlaD